MNELVFFAGVVAGMGAGVFVYTRLWRPDGVVGAR